jgi:hypothetical protein
MVYFINYIRLLTPRQRKTTGNNARYPFKFMIKVDNMEIQAMISAIANRLVSSVIGKQTSDSNIDLFMLLNG